MEKKFAPHESNEVKNLFKKHFGLDFKDFFENFGPHDLVNPKIRIDIFKFDDYLLNTFEDEYDDDKMSMSEFVLSKFGKDAYEFLEKLI